MKKKTTLGLPVILIALAATVCTGCKKDELSTTGIKMTTTKAIGERIKIAIVAAEADQAGVWIDLNNNGKQDDGEKVTKFYKQGREGTFVQYTLSSQTVTLYGKVTKLYCRDNQLIVLDVSKGTALVDLQCGGNPLTTLDVSKNTALVDLECSYNERLTTLDISKNTALETLFCEKDKLTSLDVSKNKALRQLYCEYNQINLEAMTKLVEGLPMRPSNDGEKGIFSPLGGENQFSEALEAAVYRKNWKMRFGNHSAP